jgi:periplasmic divalent cation tolerance protein
VSSTPALRVVLTTLPDAEIAGRLAREMVEAKLAACVHVMSPCRSVYRWQGAVQEDGEIPLVIKTTAAGYAALETFLRQNHPYEIPEILALDVAEGLPDYLRWAADAVLA